MHRLIFTLVFFLPALSLCAATTTPESESTAAVSFELDVQPILAARGCSAGACHGKARGQNGFQLSLLGFDSDFDYAALTQQARGRRVFPAAPERSLLLKKGAAEVPHGGGARLEAGGKDYQTILTWIESGMPRRLPNEPSLVGIEMTPKEKFLSPGESQDLTVTAHYSDNTTREVTDRTTFQSNDSPIAGVDESGVTTAGQIPGEAAIMARYMGAVAVTNVVIPLSGEVPQQLYDKLPRNNFIDEFVWQKLQDLGITPSAPAGDEKFLRRAYIDIIGRLPSPEETRTFLDDPSEGKRDALIASLLERPEYADHWASQWADLLLTNPYRVGIKATLNYDHWIRQSFRENKPYDQFVRELITAQGSSWRNGATVLFRDRRSPDEIATMVSQLFLGIRLECAKCHHHPSEKWEQADFYHLAAYFAKIGRKGRGLSPPISGSEEMVYLSDRGEVKHPLTQQTLAPKPLFGEAPEIAPDMDPRHALADWMISDDNEYFRKVIVNRVWAAMMGRGIVEPVDDLRDTNPASNEPLLTALADEFVRQDYDLKSLIKTIASSYVYSLSSTPTERNIADNRYFSRHYRQRLRGETLADALCDVTGTTNDYSAMPVNSRANQLWTRRIESLTLDTFGRPDENQDPPCERTGETAVTQALHLMNAPDLHNKLTSDSGRAAKLADSDLSVEEIVEEIYLTVYNRYPQPEETKAALAYFGREGMTRRRATSDLMWAAINTPEFIFKD